MKQPYYIYSQDGDVVVMVATASVRFSRANRQALKLVGTYPGIFFAHSETSERHKPSKYVAAPEDTVATQNRMRRLMAAQVPQSMKRMEQKRARSKNAPVSDEMVDAFRARQATNAVAKESA